MWNFLVCTPQHQIKQAAMGEACCKYGGEEKCIQDFSDVNLKERDNLEDAGTDGIHLAQE